MFLLVADHFSRSCSRLSARPDSSRARFASSIIVVELESRLSAPASSSPDVAPADGPEKLRSYCDLLRARTFRFTDRTAAKSSAELISTDLLRARRLKLLSGLVSVPFGSGETELPGGQKSQEPSLEAQT